MNQLLKDFGRKRSLNKCNPVSQQDILKFENHFKVKLPSLIRSFYMQTNGFEPTSNLMTFWNLSEIGPVTEKLPIHYSNPDYRGIEFSLPNAEEFFAFADWSIWCHIYAFKLTQDPDQAAPVVRIDNGQTWHVAFESFEAFLESYLSDCEDGLTPPGL